MRAILVVLLVAGALTLVFWAGAESGARSERALRARQSEPLVGTETEFEAALGIADAGARARALAKVLEKAGPGDIDAVFRIIERTNLPVDSLALVLVSDRAAAIDPRSAYEHLKAQQHPDTHIAASAIVRRWARQDPAEARRLVEAMNTPLGIDPFLEAFVTGWAERQGDDGPWAYVEAMDAGIMRQKLIHVLVRRRLVNEGVESTLRFVESIPDDALRRFKLQAFRRTAASLASQDPRRAAQWARQHVGAAYADGVLRKVGTKWVALEGAPGFAWLLDVEPGPQRDEAVRETYRAWLTLDRAAALAWLRQAPDHPALEPALVLLVGVTARSHPAQALTLLPRLQDPGLRESAKLRLGRMWLSVDAEAATEWIRGESGFSEDLQKRLLEGSAGIGIPSRQIPLEAKR